MSASRTRDTAFRLVRRQRSLALTAMVAGIAGLALFAVVLASALLARVASGYAGGIVLGAGAIGLAWAIFTTGRILRSRGPRVPGRSQTADCRRVRVHARRDLAGQPRFPAAADHRSVPCRNSRHPGR